MQRKDLQDYIEMDQSVEQFNQLIQFIPYSPTMHNYISKYQLKSQQFILKSEEFLPTLMINEKLQHKIKYHKQFKQAFGITNLLQFETNIAVDLISYDIDEGYTNKLEQDEMYSILISFSADINSSILLQQMCVHLKSIGSAFNSNNIELMYLNMFRIAMFINKSNKLTTYLRYPSISFKMQEIKQPNKFVETPLTRMITKSRSQSSQKKDRVQYKFGFLSLDQSNRILPLMGQDPLVLQIPLIGAWIYSNDTYDDPLTKRWLIWAMLAEFVTSNTIKQRICKDNQDQFLFILFQKCQSPQFYEVALEEDPMYKIVRSQEKPINLDNHIIDLAAAMPLAYLEKSSDLLATSIKQNEQSFQQESVYKQPPLPTPINKDPMIDHNSSISSAHFANQSLKEEPQRESVTDRLVIMQSEQLKQLQLQINDLQKALINQQHQSQIIMPTHYGQQDNLSMNYPNMRTIDPRVCVSQFPVRVDSPPKLYKHIEQTFSNLPAQKLDFMNEQIKLKTQSRKKDQEIEDIVSSLISESKVPNKDSCVSSCRTSIVKPSLKQPTGSSDKSLYSAYQQYDSPPQTQVDKKSNLSQLMMSNKDVKESMKVVQQFKTIQEEDDKENKSMRINQINMLDQSTGQGIPKIRFNLKDCEDSDSDAEIKKLEMKYLRRRL